MIYRDGNVEIEVDDALSGLVDHLLAGAPGRISRRFMAEAERIVGEAKAIWPVRSGKSRDSFVVRTRLDATGIETVITNTASHAYKIRWSKYTEAELRAAGKSPGQARYLRRQHGRGAPSDDLTYQSPWQVTIRRPVVQAEPRLAEELEADILALLEGGA